MSWLRTEPSDAVYVRGEAVPVGPVVLAARVVCSTGGAWIVSDLAVEGGLGFWEPQLVVGTPCNERPQASKHAKSL